MQRYFVNPEQLNKDRVNITGDDVHHISKVMRYKAGDKIICSNGNGIDVIAEIKEITAQQVECVVVSTIEESNEAKVNITLAQSLPKADKMELIIQKGTEVGVSSFIPFVSQRTVVQLNEKKEQKKLERWHKIAKEAAEQAHRSIVPEIYSVLSWKELLIRFKQETTLIAYEKETSTALYQMVEENSQHKSFLIVIGPEGGFTEEEIKQAEEAGAISISLGKRILRAETAGIVAAANIIYHMEG